MNCVDVMAAPAMIVNQPRSTVVDVLKNVSLHCTAVGKPQPTITWTKSGGTAVDSTTGRVRLLDDDTLFIRGLMSVSRGIAQYVAVTNESSSSCWVNPSEFRGNYSSTSNYMKFVHWPLMGVLLHLVQRGGDWAGLQPAQSPPR